MAYNGISPASYTSNLTNVQLIDDISGSFNGSTTTFALTSNSTPFYSVSARSLFVVLGGIVQKPLVDYTTNGSSITFTIAPVSGLTFAARNIYGLNFLNKPNDASVVPASLSAGGPTWTSSGNLTVSGDLNVVGSFNSGTQGLFWQDNEPANFGNSNDLKIYHNATDNYFDSITTGQKIFFRTSSSTSLDTNALTILADGKIGIGITNPLDNLVVTSDNYRGITLRTATTENRPTISFVNTGSNTACYIQGNSNSIAFGTFNTDYGGHSEKIVISSSGNVGIGTTNPSDKLHVEGTLRVTGTDSRFTGAWTNFGSGTISNNTVRINGNQIQFLYSIANTIDATTNLNFRSLTSPYQSIAFFDAINMRVGIGSTNPTDKFVIVSSGNQNYEARIGGSYMVLANNSTSAGDVTQPSYTIQQNYPYASFSLGYELGSFVYADNAFSRKASVGFFKDTGTGTGIYLSPTGFANLTFAGNTGLVVRSSGNIGIGTTNPTDKLDVAGNVIPNIDATYNLGSTTKRWANIYSADLQLSNEGSQNDVDGTWGQYTIQEGENDLFLLNRRNGKKYKFVLQEVN